MGIALGKTPPEFGLVLRQFSPMPSSYKIG